MGSPHTGNHGTKHNYSSCQHCSLHHLLLSLAKGSVCVWRVCSHICVFKICCAWLIICVCVCVCVCFRYVHLCFTQLPKRNLRGFLLDTSVDKSNTSVCDFVNLLSRKKVFWKECSIDFKMLITKRDSEPCNNNTENPFWIVYQVECRSHQNKFHMKMHVCLLKPEI